MEICSKVENSSPMKRRLNDGSAEPVEQHDRVRPARSKSRTFIEGTSNTAKAGRKMRSPPASFFVYGVHPDTTKQEIVEDLYLSTIEIEEKDIETKSKPEAYL